MDGMDPKPRLKPGPDPALEPNTAGTKVPEPERDPPLEDTGDPKTMPSGSGVESLDPLR